MRWDDELTGARVRPDNVDAFLKLLEITPSIDHLGIDSLHVLLADRPRIHSGGTGSTTHPGPSGAPPGPASAVIPEIRFRIRTSLRPSSRQEPLSFPFISRIPCKGESAAHGR